MCRRRSSHISNVARPIEAARTVESLHACDGCGKILVHDLPRNALRSPLRHHRWLFLLEIVSIAHRNGRRRRVEGKSPGTRRISVEMVEVDWRAILLVTGRCCGNFVHSAGDDIWRGNFLPPRQRGNVEIIVDWR